MGNPEYVEFKFKNTYTKEIHTHYGYSYSFDRKTLYGISYYVVDLGKGKLLLLDAGIYAHIT